MICYFGCPICCCCGIIYFVKTRWFGNVGRERVVYVDREKEKIVEKKVYVTKVVKETVVKEHVTNIKVVPAPPPTEPPVWI